MAPNSKLNHVAMSVHAHLLDESTRANIVAFYGQVFGWSEQALDEPGSPLVIRVGVEPTQLVFVQPDAGDGMRPGRSSEQHATNCGSGVARRGCT
jgi:predicted enzyme related to lactoylglutathione lyase